MRKIFVRLLELSGGLMVLVVAALLSISWFLDVKRLKPQIAGRIQEAVGRPVTLDGDPRLTFLPLPTLKLADVHIGNPAGFDQPDFLYVKSFEMRVKLLPLFHKDVQVVSLSLEKPRIFLERNKSGMDNWEFVREKTETPQSNYGLSGFMVKQISLAGGTLDFIDEASGKQQEIYDMQFDLKDVSLDRPFAMTLSAKMKGKPEPVSFSLNGNVGPLGNDPGKATIPLELTLRGPDQLELSVKGHFSDIAVQPAFDMLVRLSPFSPQKVLSAIGQNDLLPPRALERIAFDTHVTGDRDVLTFADGKLDLDDSHASFSAVVKKVKGTDVSFSLTLDGIDMDRYLPSSGEASTSRQKGEAPANVSNGAENSPIPQFHLKGAIDIAKLKARGIETNDVRVNVLGENGVYTIDPWDLKIYQGTVSGRATVDMRQDVPRSDISLHAKGIHVGPLLRDLTKKEPLTGILQAQATLHMEGGRSEQIERTLSGKGDVYIRGGSLMGVSLMGVIRKVDAVLSFAQPGGVLPSTDFSELHFPFTVNGGVVSTSNATLVAHNLTATASGRANLTTHTLNFRVEPKLSTPLKSFSVKGIGVNPEVTVPVLVSGTFSSPQFRPDVSGAVQETVKEEIQKINPETAGEALKKGLPGRLRSLWGG